MNDEKIYLNQTALILEADVGVDITDATAKIIKFIKPSGLAGSFDSTTFLVAADGTFQYQIASADDINEIGDWVMWGHVTFVDDTYAAGVPQIVHVYKEGT